LTADQVFRLFSLAQRRTLTSDRVPVKTFTGELTHIQDQVLQLLGVPSTSYLVVD
jgi:hypothetical protein